MTTAALSPSVEYLENGVSLSFPVPFRFLSGAHLEVKRLTADGATSTLQFGVHYSATGGATDSGGTLTLTTSVSGARLKIRRVTPRSQQREYETLDPFPAKTHEGGLDQLMLVAQEQDVAIEDLASRAPQVPEGEVAPSFGSLASMSDGDLLEFRAGRLQRFDAEPFAGMFYAGDGNGKLIPASGTGNDPALRRDLAEPGKGASLFKYEDGDTGQGFQERFALPTGVNTAAELEAFLTANEGRAILKPGTTYTVETLLLPTEDNLFIDGQGSTLTNVNATPLDENDIVNTTFVPGTSHPRADGNLTFHPISAVDGELLTTDGTEFEVGDLVMVRGATSYTAGPNTIYRNVIRARVLATTSTTVTLDRAVPAEISDDTPAIANSNEGVSAGGNLTLFYLYAPRIQNLTLASAEGSPMQRGGCIDGIFRNITFVGRNSLVMNAMQDCLFDGVRFHTWRKMAELAQACRGTTVRNLRGSLSDGSTKNGGASDSTSFFIGIHENSVECTIEDIDVNSGPNDPGTGISAMQLGGGRRNVIRNGIARFPEHTGTGLSIQSGPSNADNEDCGFENLTVYLPKAATLLRVSDVGSGVIRPYARNLTVFGTASTGFAADLCGSDGVFENLWFEDGGCRLNTLGTLENCRITGCYFPDGFTNLTQELLATNDIRDNQSDASRRIMAAAKVAATQTTVSETTANTAFSAATMTIAAGDLATGDAVHLRLAGTKGGTNNAHIRVTCQTDGSTPFELAHIQTTTSGDAWEIAGAIEVQSNTAVYWRGQQVTSAGATGLGVRNTGGNLTNNALVVTVEIWTETSGNVTVQSYAIAGQKLGMRNVRVFA